MRSLFLITLLFCNHSMAFDNWFCTTQSSEMKGDSFYSCGVGEDIGEESAREEATYKAKMEFFWFCDASQKCTYNKWKVKTEPKRMECEVVGTSASGKKIYKCYRLIVYHLDLD